METVVGQFGSMPKLDSAVYSEIADRCLKDPKFARVLNLDPIGTLASMGIELDSARRGLLEGKCLTQVAGNGQYAAGNVAVVVVVINIAT